MSVITREQFERLAGVRNFTTIKKGFHAGGVKVNVPDVDLMPSTNDPEYFDDFGFDDNEDYSYGSCDDGCDGCEDYDLCWGEDTYEDYSLDDSQDEGYECDCEYCRSQDEDFGDGDPFYESDENVDPDVETMELIFDEGDWKTAKEFIYLVINEDYNIPSQKIVEFVNEYLDDTVKIGTVAALRASWSRAN